jgi:hypothetical protein
MCSFDVNLSRTMKVPSAKTCGKIITITRLERTSLPR